MSRTFAEWSHDAAPRSLWFEQLVRWAAPTQVDEWLVEEANARGFLGASGRELPSRPPDARLSNEDLVVALLSPHSSVDGRVFKLIVRMIQSGRLELERLKLRSKQHRAQGALHWLLGMVPAAEKNESVLAAAAVITAPRGYRPPRYRYDADRLIRRPATKESLWRAHRS